MRVNQENKSVDMEARDINYILPAYVRSYLFYSKNEMPEKIVFPMFPSVLVQGKEIPIEYVPPLDAVAVEIAKDGTDVAEVTPEQEAVLDEKDEKIEELKAEVESLTAPNVDNTQEEEDDGIDCPFERVRRYPDCYEDCPDTDKCPKHAEAAKEVSPARAAFAEEPDSIITPNFENLKVVTEKGTTTLDAPPDRQPKQPPGGDIGPGLGLSDTHARDRRDQTRTARDLMEEPNINEAEEKEFDQTVSRDEEGRPVVEDKNE